MVGLMEHEKVLADNIMVYKLWVEVDIEESDNIV